MVKALASMKDGNVFPDPFDVLCIFIMLLEM